MAWDLRGDQRFIRRLVPAELGDSFSDLAAPAPDGKAVAYFDSTTATEQREDDPLPRRHHRRARRADPSRHSNWSWRPDGEHFATADADGFVRVWDWRRGELIAERQVTQGDIAGIAYTHDGRRIVVGDRSGAVYQIDATALRPVADRVQLDRAVRNVFTAPNSRIAFALLRGDAYTSIDFDEGRVVQRDAGLAPSWVDASPDGTSLAVGATTGEVGVIDLRSGEWVRPPVDAHEGWVQRVAYAPDGATFASAGNDGQVASGTARPARELPPWYQGAGHVWATVEFQPDGHTLIVVGRDGNVHTIDTRLDSWIDRACSIGGTQPHPARMGRGHPRPPLPRNLPRSERQQGPGGVIRVRRPPAQAAHDATVPKAPTSRSGVPDGYRSSSFRGGVRHRARRWCAEGIRVTGRRVDSSSKGWRVGCELSVSRRQRGE